MLDVPFGPLFLVGRPWRGRGRPAEAHSVARSAAAVRSGPPPGAARRPRATNTQVMRGLPPLQLTRTRVHSWMNTRATAHSLCHVPPLSAAACPPRRRRAAAAAAVAAAAAPSAWRRGPPKPTTAPGVPRPHGLLGTLRMFGGCIRGCMCLAELACRVLEAPSCGWKRINVVDLMPAVSGCVAQTRQSSHMAPGLLTIAFLLVELA